MDYLSLNPLKLAFLGDAVFELYVREKLIFTHLEKLGDLNEKKAKLSCCKGQSNIMEKIYPILTDEEKEMYRRGKNAKIKNFSKKSSLSDYRKATGLECLIGYLYFNKKLNRIGEILQNLKIN